MRSLRIFIVLSFILIFASYDLYAKLSFSQSYAIISSNGNRILVMLTDSPEEDEPFMLPNGKKIDLRKTFQHSGVFDLTTNKLIWQFDWYSNEFEILTSDDFSSIIRLNEFALVSPDKWGLIFIYNGKVVKTYSIDDLLINFRSKYYFPFETGGYYYRWNDDFSLTGDRLKLVVTQRQIQIYSYAIQLGYQETYYLDIKTGEIVEKHIQNIPLNIIVILTFVLFIVILVIFFLKRYKRHQSHQNYDLDAIGTSSEERGIDKLEL